MAQHGAGRGGRGYAFLFSKRDEGKPGLSEKLQTAKNIPGAMHGSSGAVFTRSSIHPASVDLEADPHKERIPRTRKELSASATSKFLDEEYSSRVQQPIASNFGDDDDLSDIGTLSISKELSVKDHAINQLSLDSGHPSTRSSSLEQAPPMRGLNLSDSSRDKTGKQFLQFSRGVGMPGRGAALADQSVPAKTIHSMTGPPRISGVASSRVVHRPSMFAARGGGLSVDGDRIEAKQDHKPGGITVETATHSGHGLSTSRLDSTFRKTVQCGDINVSSNQAVDAKSQALPGKSPSVATSVVEKNVHYHGSYGVRTPARVNCVRIRCKNPAIYQYHVSFDPNIDSRNLRFALVNQHRDLLGQKAFDGTILYLTKHLEASESCLVSERVTDGAKVKIKIALTSTLNPSSHRLIPFYNIVMHRVMKILKMCPVGRNYYDPAGSRSVEKYKLQLWPGYVTSIREMEGGLFLNIDTSHKVLRNETVLTAMQQLFRNEADFQGKCIKELVGAVVLTRYNNNNYRIDDIDWSMTPMSTFTTSKGETLSFFQYYKTQYQIEIKDLKQPMLVNRPKKATQRSSRMEKGEDSVISLVPELCFLTGISDKLANDFSAMKDIGEITRLNPVERNNQILQFLKRVDSSMEAKKELLKWGLELDTECVPIESRVFQPEKVMVGNNCTFQCKEDVDFFRDISRAPVLRSVPIHNWIIVFTARDAGKARDFAKKLDEVSKSVGMSVRPPQFVQLRDDRSDSFKHAISSAISPSLQLVVCIFPTLRDDRYSAVKRLCCVDMPIPSQVIISKTLPKDSKVGKFRSVTMKIALQINCKLGGELWALSIPLSGLMVCGIDVYHEGKQGKGRSVAGFVASMNKLVTQWHSKTVVQQQNQELMDSLKHCFCETLVKYHEINGKLPDRIVIYRDGVGDGQLPIVAEHEVQQLKSAVKMFDEIAGGKYLPKFTFVVVSKRVNVKYFKETGKFMNNPPPGTVLDHTITRPNWPDFYLVSQHVRQGTVSPTHYIVVEGSCHLNPDHLQRLTYKLTHMYYNWPGTVRVPAPCQYAHKLAYLVGESIRKEPAPTLCDRLFYL